MFNSEHYVAGVCVCDIKGLGPLTISVPVQDLLNGIITSYLI